jgi:hypothetical protein
MGVLSHSPHPGTALLFPFVGRAPASHCPDPCATLLVPNSKAPPFNVLLANPPKITVFRFSS